MRLLIIDQCSGLKDYPSGSQVFSADEIDNASREALLERDGVARQQARKLYSGRQQIYINEAVDILDKSGHEVDRYFISAGFGLVAESTDLPPYEVTFNGMSTTAIKKRAAQLDLTTAVTDLVAATPPYDVIFFALGSKYYEALDLENVLVSLSADSIGVLFNQEDSVEGCSNIISIPARTEEAKEHRTIAVALKGVYLKHFARYVAAGEPVTSPDDVIEYCTSTWPPQSGFDSYE